MVRERGVVKRDWMVVVGSERGERVVQSEDAGAEHVTLSTKTVQNHLRLPFTRYGAPPRTELTHFATCCPWLCPLVKGE